MNHFKLILFACALCCSVFPVTAGLVQYEYNGFVSVIIQTGETDTFFNRAVLPAGTSPMTGAPVNGRFWFDSDWYTTTTGIFEIPAMEKGVTANVIRINPATGLPIPVRPLHFENDVNVDPSGFDAALGLLPGGMWNAYKSDLIVANGFHGLFGWFVGGMSTSNPAKWPVAEPLPFFLRDTTYKGLAVGRLGDLNPNPLAFNFGMIGGWNWSTELSEFYMIGFSMYNVRAIATAPASVPTPEPGTFLLLGAGLVGVGWLMRRRVA